MRGEKQGDIKRISPDYYNERYFTNNWYDSKSFALDNLFHRDVAELFVDIMKPLKYDSVLSIGCAFGNVIYWLNKMGYDGHGIDISEYAISHTHIPGRVTQGDVINGLSYKDGIFDYIFSRDTFEHIAEEHVPKVIAEMERVLKVDGGILLMPANNFNDKEIRKQMNCAGPNHEDGSHLCVKPPYWWAEMIEKHGKKLIVDYKRTLYGMAVPMAEKNSWTALVVRKTI